MTITINTIVLVIVLLLSVLLVTTAKVWDPQTDPLPPIQPAEVGININEYNNYTVVDSSQQFINKEVFSYTFQSLQYLVEYSMSNGVDYLVKEDNAYSYSSTYSESDSGSNSYGNNNPDNDPDGDSVSNSNSNGKSNINGNDNEYQRQQLQLQQQQLQRRQRTMNSINFINNQFNHIANSVVDYTSNSEDDGTGAATWFYTNYTATYNNSCSCDYTRQNCLCGTITGGKAIYPGYNYYQNLLLAYHDDGILINYYNYNSEQYGVMLVYEVLPSWNSTKLPRHVNYTIEFQNSTGYLRKYTQYGYEYCCDNTKTCVNDHQELCSDGSAPILIYSYQLLSYLNYQIVTEWAKGFFGYYYPSFPSMIPPTPHPSKCPTDNYIKNLDDSILLTFLPIVFYILGVVSVSTN